MVNPIPSLAETISRMQAPKKNRGFACMAPERRHEIAAKGGSAVAPDKRAFSQDRDLAASAGRKGGLVRPTNKENPNAVR